MISVMIGPGTTPLSKCPNNNVLLKKDCRKQRQKPINWQLKHYHEKLIKVLYSADTLKSNMQLNLHEVLLVHRKSMHGYRYDTVSRNGTFYFFWQHWIHKLRQQLKGNKKTFFISSTFLFWSILKYIWISKFMFIQVRQRTFDVFVLFFSLGIGVGLAIKSERFNIFKRNVTKLHIKL